MCPKNKNLHSSMDRLKEKKDVKNDAKHKYLHSSMDRLKAIVPLPSPSKTT